MLALSGVEIGGKLLRCLPPTVPAKQHTAGKIHSYSFNNKRSFLRPFSLALNRFIPCCDDERCAFVETATTSTPSTDCGEGVVCIACVYFGYFLATAQLTSSLDRFILRLQQNIPSLFNRSSTAGSRKSLRSIFPQRRRMKLFHGQSVGRKLAHTKSREEKMQSEISSENITAMRPSIE
jgi:hypothetical protein